MYLARCLGGEAAGEPAFPVPLIQTLLFQSCLTNSKGTRSEVKAQNEGKPYKSYSIANTHASSKKL